MPLFFKLPHPGGPAYDPALNPAGAKKWTPPPKPPFAVYPPPTAVASAAIYGKVVSIEYLSNPGEEMREVIPELFDYRTTCPGKDCKAQYTDIDLYRLIQHLNDDHAWTRETIADWLDTLDVDLTFKAKGGDHADEQDSDEKG